MIMIYVMLQESHRICAVNFVSIKTSAADMMVAKKRRMMGNEGIHNGDQQGNI